MIAFRYRELSFNLFTRDGCNVYDTSGKFEGDRAGVGSWKL